MVMNISVEEVERELARLRADHIATAERLAEIEAELAPAEAKLADAQRVYDEAAEAVAIAMQAIGPGDPTATWSPRGTDQEARLSEQLTLTRQLFDAAERSLQPALVARTSLAARRSDARMRQRMLTDLVEQSEAKLDRMRRDAQQDRGALERIRVKLGLAS
jgi:hypothetical protein